MEPIYTTEIEYVNKDAEEAIFSVLAKRRGNVYFLGPKPGTPNYIMKAHLPCL